VGVWLPWDPNAYKTGRVEFMEEELNQLYHEKMKNEAKAKDEFDKRIKDTKQKAIEDNIQKAEKSGNVLTQSINEEGELVGVRDTIDFASREVADDAGKEAHEKSVVENAQSADIRSEYLQSE